jgi:acyl-CoA hydrolase
MAPHAVAPEAHAIPAGPATAVERPGGEDRPRRVTLAQVMLPEDANPRGNVPGGALMTLADTAGGTCAGRHARSQVVTVVMDSMTFEQPVYVGDLVTLYAEVTWTGRTSLETQVVIEAENVVTGNVRRVSSAYLVYVALDAEGRPKPVPPLVVDTEAARRRWQEAEGRRARRLRESA